MLRKNPEITNIAIVTDGRSAVAAYLAGDLLRHCATLSPSDHSDASLLTEAISNHPPAHCSTETIEVRIARDKGEEVLSSVSVVKWPETGAKNG